MANKPLQSIKFPDLPDIYTIPVVDSTLAVSGAAADAKQTGDSLANKVDKVSDKGLSTEDYTTEEKTKLANVETEANKTIIDSTLTVTGNAADAKAVGDVIASEDKKTLAAFATDTASGSIASFADGADNIPMKDVLAHIEPVQAGSGDPSPDNVRPISGWTGAKVTRTGKNLWKFDASYSSSGYAVLINKQPFYLPVGTYTFSAIPNISSDSIVLFGYHADGTRTEIARLSSSTSRQSASCTITNPVVSAFLVSNMGGTISDIQLELGSTATAYEPYTGQTYPITFPTEAGTVYGGYVDVTGGELVADRCFLEGINWTEYKRNNGFVAYRRSNAPNANDTNWFCESISNIISDFEYFNSNAMTKNIIQINGSSLYMALSEEVDASQVQLSYKLATPIHYPLTPQEITSLLGTNNVWADTGDSDVEYRADTKLYITKKITEAVSALS